MKNPEALPKTYDAAAVEDAIYKEWEASGVFNPDELAKKDARFADGAPFCIAMPPPNVTGVLHLGHALENALMDTMARFQRMRGKRVLLVPGTDHAAIATQAKVEKMLIAGGMKNPRQELGREALIGKIREFAEQSKATILSQVRKVGTSCDWSRLAYTFDDARNKAVKELFARMYADGLIYRGYRVVNWSVKGQSTCSDDEIVYVEQPTKLYTFKYAKDFPITIATTRPETKLGDTAVAVHPSDERYKEYIGKTFTADVGAAKPLEIKIIADEGVDPAFGTGAVGVTPAHSPVDFAMYEKQKAAGNPIAIIPVIGPDGKMTAEAGKGYAGLTALEAREKFVAWLREQDLLVAEEDITHSVGTSDRYGDVIESIPMTQWWLDVNKVIPSRGKSLRDLMREAVTTGLGGDESKKVAITPDRFTKLYLDRVENLRDWCLSRQLWWGHRIPAWYRKAGDKEQGSGVRGEGGGMRDGGGEGNDLPSLPREGSGEGRLEIFVGTEAPEGEGWEQDSDTLDTWFSSGSWTFSTLGWPEQSKDLATFHPTAWMQMGYEILYLWLMRMILMSAYALDEIPFKNAYIHGILRDKDGKKFSKSSGNGIDPIDVVNEYGCDALRISLLIGISPGNDSRYYTEKIESGRNFVNKLWNISRFILMQIEEGAEGQGLRAESLNPKTLADGWILARLDEVTASVTKKIENDEFSAAGEELRDFTWGDLADWYLEIAKVEKGKDAILLHILKTILKLWHPFMPFVTTHIWKLAEFEGDLIIAEWPKSEEGSGVRGQGSNFETIRTLVTDLRRLRAEQGIEPAKQISAAIAADNSVKSLVEANIEIIKALVRASSIETVGAIAEGWATAVSGTATIGIDVAGAVDITKEKAKIEKELSETAAYIASTGAKLANAEFASKAPPHVVESMKSKLAEAESKKQALEERMRMF
jgi:valyl-tRNA synthetase